MLEAVPHEVSKWAAPSEGKICVPSTRIFAVNTHARMGSIASFPDTAPLRVAVNPLFRGGFRRVCGGMDGGDENKERAPLEGYCERHDRTKIYCCSPRPI